MLTIDYANCLSGRVGAHGIDAASLQPGSASARRAEEMTAELGRTRGAGWERWRQLPFEPMRSEHVRAVKALVEERMGKFDTLVVLGIGGSALGNTALQAALTPPTHNLLPSSLRRGPRLFVLDNVDPANLGAALEFVKDKASGGLERTLFNVISKSGETAETAAQFMLVRRTLIEALGEKRHAAHVVAITDPAKGTMRSICNKEGYATLPVPDGVGGRFSVLSPVGLFSAAMCGIDIDALLAGAAEMDERCSRPQLGSNPAALLATLLVRLGLEKGKVMHVMLPYSNALYYMADWFRQLWAESLGKRFDRTGKEVHTGFTPIKALGATDQHSQIQLYREGPNDKVVGFVEVESFGRADALRTPEGGAMGVDALTYLENKSFARLLNAEKRATEYALVESVRPNFTVRMPAITERHIGAFIQLFQVATAYAGLMLGIDPYDQPAVETGKQATFGLMGRAGYEAWREKTERALAPTQFVV